MERRTLVSRVATGLSTVPVAEDAAGEAASVVRSSLGDDPVDLAFLFLSPDHLGGVEDAVSVVHDVLEPHRLLGCVAEGVVGGAREIERGPGLSLWAGSLPGASFETFHLVAVPSDEGLAVTGFPALDGDPALLALLVDPFTFPAASFLHALNDEQPGVPVVGGIASGAGAPGAQALVLDDELYAEGAVGVACAGIPVLTAVSQGCAPIGREAVVTRAEGNVVFELAGEPALERLKEDVLALPPEKQELAAAGILAGLVIDENRAEYGRGDFLMRAVLGADEDTGALAIGETVRVGQTLRFHVRDAASADEDLRETLAREVGGAPAAGALLFTCNGRGTHMFAEADHDARAVVEALGGPAVAGFFCGGEIGPVGGRPFLHGFTATLAVFLERPT